MAHIQNRVPVADDPGELGLDSRVRRPGCRSDTFIGPVALGWQPV